MARAFRRLCEIVAFVAIVRRSVVIRDHWLCCFVQIAGYDRTRPNRTRQRTAKNIGQRHSAMPATCTFSDWRTSRIVRNQRSVRWRTTDWCGRIRVIFLVHFVLLWLIRRTIQLVLSTQLKLSGSQMIGTETCNLALTLIRFLGRPRPSIVDTVTLMSLTMSSRYL